LNSRSAVRIRLPASKLPAFLRLAGQSLELDGHRLRLGVPNVAALIPAPTLSSDLVLIKLAHTDEKKARNAVTPEAFLAAATKQLTAMQIIALPALQLTRTGPHTGQPRRRIMKVKSQTHAGYAMIVEGLTAEESLRLQEQGLGGRRLMGCGLFLPVGKDLPHVTSL
jgi:CRISPR-associated protein Cas6